MATTNFFISYTRADRGWAEWIAWHLEAAGYTTTIQAWDSRPGMNFLAWMDQAAKEAERTLVTLSPAYERAEGFTVPEWTAAMHSDPGGRQGLLVPVRVAEVASTGLLGSLGWIDLVGLDEDQAKAALLEGVRQERLKPRVAPAFPGGQPAKPSFPGATDRQAPPEPAYPGRGFPTGLVKAAAPVRPHSAGARHKHRRYSRRSIAAIALTALLVIGGSVELARRASKPVFPKDPPVTLLYLDPTLSDSDENVLLQSAAVVVDQVAAERGRLIVDVLNDNPLGRSQIPADIQFPAKRGLNRVQEQAFVNVRKADCMQEIRSVFARDPPSPQLDLFGTLTAASQRLQVFAKPARRRIVFLSSMVMAARQYKRVVGNWNGLVIEELIADLRAKDELPDLNGVEVWVGGAGLGTRPGNGAAPADEILRLRSIWLAVFEATGARVVYYGQALFR